MVYSNSDDSETSEVQVVIVGGGITGLSLAAVLDEKQVPFTLLEKTGRFGGQIRTLEENGYIFETGPNTGTVSTPEVIELFNYAQGCQIQLADKAAESRWIWKDGKFHRLPSGLISAVTTPLFTWRDKLRVLAEPFRAKGTDPNETVGKLAERRLGKSFVDYAVDPFVGGIYAGDPYQMVTRFALSKLYDLEQNYGSFIKGTIAKMREPKTARDKLATKEVFSAVGGLEKLVEAVVERAGKKNQLLSNTTNIKLTKTADGWVVEYCHNDKIYQVKTRYVVTTVPSYSLPEILPDEVGDLSAITSMDFAPVVEVAVGFDHLPEISVPAFGGLIPSIAKKQVLGILFPSSCFSGRVPYPDSKLFTVYLGGTRRGTEILALTDDEIKNLAVDETKSLLGISSSHTPELVHMARHEFAIPQYDETTEQRLAAVAEIEQCCPGLIIAGGLKDGIGLAKRISQGATIARKIAETK